MRGRKTKSDLTKDQNKLMHQNNRRFWAWLRGETRKKLCDNFTRTFSRTTVAAFCSSALFNHAVHCACARYDERLPWCFHVVELHFCHTVIEAKELPMLLNGQPSDLFFDIKLKSQPLITHKSKLFPVRVELLLNFVFVFSESCTTGNYRTTLGWVFHL